MLRPMKIAARFLIVAAAFLMFSASVMAQDADIKDKAAVCASCHGEKGVPIDKVTPNIWGQKEGYLYLQLRDFKAGARKNEIMSAIVADLTKEDMQALAAYFTALPWPDLACFTCRVLASLQHHMLSGVYAPRV